VLIRIRVQLLLVVSLGFGLGCATTAPAPAPTGELFLWEVERSDGAGGVAHVLGSVHLSEDELTFDPVVDRALADADTLVLEIDPDEADPAEISLLSVEIGYFLDGRTLLEVVGQGTFGALGRRVAELELPLSGFRSMKPWLALLTLQVLELQQEGYDLGKGVEQRLVEDAAETGKPTEGLETPEEQLRAFDHMPLEIQVRLLDEFLRRGDEEDIISVLMEAWRLGDDARLEQEVFGELASDPSLAPFFEALYFERNARMARGIAERVDAGGRWFVAVGAAHVVGARGVPSLLRQHGYRVRRLPKTVH